MFKTYNGIDKIYVQTNKKGSKCIEHFDTDIHKHVHESIYMCLLIKG